MDSKWSFEKVTTQIADTGDYDGYIIFTDGKKTLQTNSEDVSDDDLRLFCALIDLMPDLWEYNNDELKFELNEIKKANKKMRHFLETFLYLNDSKNGLSAERVEAAKVIIRNILEEVDNHLL